MLLWPPPGSKFSVPPSFAHMSSIVPHAKMLLWPPPGSILRSMAWHNEHCYHQNHKRNNSNCGPAGWGALTGGSLSSMCFPCPSMFLLHATSMYFHVLHPLCSFCVLLLCTCMYVHVVPCAFHATSMYFHALHVLPWSCVCLFHVLPCTPMSSMSV